jgi:4-hydroxy-tetrahydrodipicolinate synthase
MSQTFKPEGMVIPLLTPFAQDSSLDEQALRRSVRRLIDAGVHGVFPVGSSGEFWSLGAEERCRAIEIVVEEAAGQVPVYAGTGHIGTREAVQLTQRAESIGADAIVVVTPFYVAPSQDELYAHYATIADSTSLPVFPYNNPKRTGGVSLGPDTLARLAGLPNLAGIKDSSGNLALTAEYINQTPDSFAVFQGSDDLFYPSLAMGAVGGIAATGNVAPEIVVELYEAFRDGDWECSRAAQVKLASLRRASSWGSYPSVLKAAMAMIGEPVGPPRAPVSPLDDSYHEALRQVLVGMGLTTQDC